ncbi:Nif3-like dinuclear metal center hexameric protein [Fredinandcohnia sp. 179-A 10B2 NHS]|uniref:Nif3-like dinuclear metal center hexameric protein n=1 Tax=Fredinandcohnia sp. 179-A 10B2 NHS TaxID=3235176 RepID=UPI0039A23B1C
MGLTIQDVIDKLISPIGVIENTVDTLKFGSPNTEITGIAVSFIPTTHVIKQAIDLGANLLVTHEGAFFSHWDKNELGENQVFNAKYKLINESGIGIFRFHDYLHRYEPDGIMIGLIQALEWERYVEENLPAATIVSIPTMTVEEVAGHVKDKLKIDFIRAMGNLSSPCNRIGLLAGYRGGGPVTIPLFEKYNLDLVLYGEGPEWETPEYVRDAIQQDKKKALLVLGHAESEEPGMKYLSELMRGWFPSIPVHFIAEKPLFTSI